MHWVSSGEERSRGVKWRGMRTKKMATRTIALIDLIMMQSGERWAAHETSLIHSEHYLLLSLAIQLLAYPSCSYCQSALHRPFLCLECALPACFYTHIDNVKDCIRDHLSDSKHYIGELEQCIRGDRSRSSRLTSWWRCIGFDLFEGTLYCAECEDIIYSADFHEVYLREKGRVVGRRQSNTTQTEHRSSKEGGASICRGEMWQGIGSVDQD